MASFRQRAGIWQARIKQKGFPDQTKSFETKAKAQQWARSIEAKMDGGDYRSTGIAKNLLLTDILDRYVNSVTPLKRGSVRESESIRFMQRQQIAQYSMANLTPAVIALYRDERLKTISNGTIIRELCILSSIITHARKEWGLAIENPCALVRKPPTPNGRNRILNANEEEKLLYELKPTHRRSSLMIPIVTLALETAMRRGELLALKWENIDLTSQTAILPMTKNGTSRVVPLSKRAVSILSELHGDRQGSVFRISYMTLNNCFVHARERAGLKDLHFHDLRHTATSRLAERLPNVIELAAVTGHQTIQMLKRYYHPKAEALAQKLG